MKKIRSSFIFFCLIFIGIQCFQVKHAHSMRPTYYTIHELRVTCQPSGSQNGYTLNFWGISDRHYFFGSRQVNDDIIIHSFSGKITKNTLQINGVGQRGKDTWKLLFSDKFENPQPLNKVLKNGLWGKHGNRKCKIESIGSYPLNNIRLYANLKKEKSELEKKLEEFETDPLLALKNAIETAGKNEDEVQQEIKKLIQEREKAKKELIKQLEFEKAEIAEAEIRTQKL